MSTLKVLLVDDEQELVTTLVERLGYRGVEAAYALNGPEALDKLRQGHFSVVVLDVKLPGMSGLEVLTRMKKEFPNIPVILITGHGSPVEQPDQVPEDAYDYLPKPISLDKLLQKIKEATGQV